MCSTGMGPREVGELTLFDVEDLNTYWERYPPVHVMVAAYLGVKPKEKTRPLTRDDTAELMKFLGG